MPAKFASQLFAAIVGICLIAGQAVAGPLPMLPFYGSVTYAADCTSTDQAYTDDMLMLARVASSSTYFEDCVTEAMTANWNLHAFPTYCFEDPDNGNGVGPYAACNGDPEQYESMRVWLADSRSEFDALGG